MITIRPSYTSMYPDCNRRQSARMFPIQIGEAGYHLRQLEPSVGASVGTATHSAVAFAMVHKMAHGAPPTSNDDAEAVGMAALKERIGTEGVQWDATTPNLNTAQKQVRRQYRAYRMTLAETLMPIAIERRIEVPTRRGNVLSGQIDLTDAGIRDLKTGTTARGNASQYGCYSMLRRAEGGHVQHIVEDFVQRVAIDKQQPMPVEIHYDVQLAERVAANVVERIETDYEQFIATGDPLSFQANPNSMLCMARWCAAHGTDYCREHRR